MTYTEQLKTLSERIDAVGIALCGLVLEGAKVSRVRQMAYDYVKLVEYRQYLIVSEANRSWEL